MKKIIIAALIGFAVAPQAHAAGDPTSPRMLPAGSVISGAAGKAGSVDLYSFMTLPGDKHEITVLSNSKKPLEVQLLDPGGNVIMQGSGVGKVELEAIAAWGDAYSVAVIRSDPTAKYSIQRMTTAGTLQQFWLSRMTGYKRTEDPIATRCWTKPGESIRITFDDFVLERSIVGQRQNNRRIRADGSTTLSSTTIVVEGNDIATIEDEGGKVRKTLQSFKQEDLRYSPNYEFAGYTCDSTF